MSLSLPSDHPMGGISVHMSKLFLGSTSLEPTPSPASRPSLGDACTDLIIREFAAPTDHHGGMSDRDTSTMSVGSSSAGATPRPRRASISSLTSMSAEELESLARFPSSMLIQLPCIDTLTTAINITSISDLNHPASFNTIPVRRCAFDGADPTPYLPPIVWRTVKQLDIGDSVRVLGDEPSRQAYQIQCECGQYACQYRIVCSCRIHNCPWPGHLHEDDSYPDYDITRYHQARTATK